MHVQSPEPQGYGMIAPPRMRAQRDERAPYQSGSIANNMLGAWRPRLTSVHDDLRTSHVVRARARDLVRNNPIARQAVRISRQGTIGTRLRLKLTIDWKFLGISIEEANRWETEVERLWEQYAHGPACWIDAGRRMNFSHMMALVHDADFIDGEALVGCEWRDAGRWNTCFQVIDVDRLSQPPTRTDSITCRAGVELDRFNAPIGYHIRNAHPNDFALGAQLAQWSLVQRETDWGRSVMLHTFDTLRAGQVRGVSEFASVIPGLKMSAEYAETELQAAVLRAMYVATINSDEDYSKVMEALGGMPVTGDDDITAAAEMLTDAGLAALQRKSQYYNEVTIGSGGLRIAHLLGKDKLDIKNAGPAASAFRDFIKSHSLQTAAGLGVDPTGITQDYEGVNYSSGKMSAVNNYRGYLHRRTRLTDQIATRMFANWLEETMHKGELWIGMPGEIDPSLFYVCKDALTRCKWITTGQPVLEPLKERQAQNMGLTMNVDTLESILAEEGETVEDVLDQRARERQMIIERGLDPMLMMTPPIEDEPENTDEKPKPEKDKAKARRVRLDA
jgi:lambda family phage portal protein